MHIHLHLTANKMFLGTATSQNCHFYGMWKSWHELNLSQFEKNRETADHARLKAFLTPIRIEIELFPYLSFLRGGKLTISVSTSDKRVLKNLNEPINGLRSINRELRIDHAILDLYFVASSTFSIWGHEKKTGEKALKIGIFNNNNKKI